ncbi:hypothetical protein HDG32_000378 [Paraburkholderia sp. CI2]|nr:hypothetical protein [Paraburkholderia sp. CI2]
MEEMSPSYRQTRTRPTNGSPYAYRPRAHVHCKAPAASSHATASHATASHATASLACAPSPATSIAADGRPARVLHAV